MVSFIETRRDRLGGMGVRGDAFNWENGVERPQQTPKRRYPEDSQIYEFISWFPHP